MFSKILCETGWFVPKIQTVEGFYKTMKTKETLPVVWLYLKLNICEQAYKKCSVCLGPSKVMGKIFCQICAWSTHHKHIAWSPYERGSGQGHFDALWCNLHLYLNLFCVNIIIFYFLVLNIFWGVNFFLGLAVPWSCGFCRPVCEFDSFYLIPSHINI